MHQANVNAISIKLPKKVVKVLQELKREKSLPSMATALEAWLNQQIQEHTDSRLVKLEESIGKMRSILVKKFERDKQVFAANCMSLQYLLGGDHPLSGRIRKVMGCKKVEECAFADCSGLVRKESEEGD